MPKKQKYQLHYLPLFEADLTEAKDYIVNKLHNPVAARKLIIATERALKQRLVAPLAFAPYKSRRKRANIYYRIYVKNYTVFYVVLGNVMEVRRFIYSGRDLAEML